jgi:hypothetical protein
MMEIARILSGMFSLKEYKNCGKRVSFRDIKKGEIFSKWSLVVFEPRMAKETKVRTIDL